MIVFFSVSKAIDFFLLAKRSSYAVGKSDCLFVKRACSVQKYDILVRIAK